MRHFSFRMETRKEVDTVNERLKKLRKALDLTQQEFAEKIGMKQNTIAQYEMGRTTPSDAIIFSICREFHVSEEWLRNGTGEMFIEQTRDEQIASFIGGLLSGEEDDFKKKLITGLAHMDESGWDALEKLANEVLKRD